jgi:ABC-type transporter Mla subunit MlaD
MKLAKDILIVLLLGCLIVVAGDAHRMFTHVDALAVEANTRLVGTSQNVNALLIQLGLTADNLRRASESERQVSKKTLSILDNTNRLLAQTQKNSTEITLHTVQTMDDIRPVLDQLTTTTKEVNKLVADDNIPQILQNLNETSKQVVVTSQHLNKTSENVDKFVAKATKPASVAKQIFKGCLSFLGGMFAHFI